MRIITLKNYAKFNPVLEILGRDPDSGRHFVSTVLISISHFDLVTVERTGEPSVLPDGGFPAGGGLPEALEIELSETSEGHFAQELLPNGGGTQTAGDSSGNSNGSAKLVALRSASGLPADMTNLAAMAWERTCKHCGAILPVKIAILKRIPFAAGLDGGSGNAAAVFIALARLFDLNVTPAEIGFLAAETGCDVPFFLSGGMMLGENFGEFLTDLGEPPEMGLLVLKPAYGSNTGEAYGAAAEMLGITGGMCRAARTTRGFINAAAGGGNVFPFIRNDFDALSMRSKEAGELIGWLQKALPEKVVVAGSGSAIAGIFRNMPEPELAAKAMNELGGSLECAFVARPVSQGIEVVDWK